MVFCQVPTKITKGQIEITTTVFLVPKGQKVRLGGSHVFNDAKFCNEDVIAPCDRWVPTFDQYSKP